MKQYQLKENQMAKKDEVPAIEKAGYNEVFTYINEALARGLEEGANVDVLFAVLSAHREIMSVRLTQAVLFQQSAAAGEEANAGGDGAPAE